MGVRMPTPPPPAPAATRLIIRAIRDEDARLVQQHPLLGKDDLVALGLWAAAWVGIAAMVAGALGPGLPLPLAAIGVALCLSTLHELEHDLIHELYWADRPWLGHLVLFSIWIAKGSLDPWSRGRIHRWHHQVSGQDDDIEERLIGLGLPWGPRRLLLSLIPAASGLVVPDIRRAVLARVALGAPRADLRAPRGWAIVQGITALMLGLPLCALIAWLVGAPWAPALLWLYVIPNMMRHTAIVVMSSNSHYTGIPRSELALQNQILDHWAFWPLQALCWNFGATHVLHHFVVKQPFWRRTLAFRRLRPTLVANGMPHHDLGSFARANQRGPALTTGRPSA
jgi:fatty acid desaturase